MNEYVGILLKSIAWSLTFVAFTGAAISGDMGPVPVCVALSAVLLLAERIQRGNR